MSIIEVPKQENAVVETPPPNPVEKRGKRAFIAFTVTVTIGLGLAGWYVGGRIFAAEQARPTVVAKSISPAPAASPTTSPAPAPTPAPIVEAQAKTPPRTGWIEPMSGELYLQLAAMGPHATDDYMKMLEGKGIRPGIAPGPAEGLFRIVMGPYPDAAALHKQQQELEAAGVESMVRVY